jgi:hypothetical protein
MKYCIIRLGKDSVSEILQIDALKGSLNPMLYLTIDCKQVPNEVDSGTYCFVWLGSDNNKGTPTSWNQGLRAFGIIEKKEGGPRYNDQWSVSFSLGFVFNDSINHHDILYSAPESYFRFSDIPIIGVNTHSNQSIQIIKTEEKTQDIEALFKAINAIEPGFLYHLNSEYPDISIDKNEIEEDYDSIESPVEVEIEDESHITSQLMNKPFNPSLINIENKLLNIDLIIKRLSQKVPEIDLYPDFQRKDDLWGITKQSRLIESILIRFPLPAFYFDGSNKNKWLVVDGLQRLSSIRNFIVTKNLKLTNLEFLTKLEGLGFDDLDRDLQRVIEETQVVAYIINPGTPNNVKFNIFKRINTGGLVLESQEIRHALYQGVPAKFVAELANLEEFKMATSYSISTSRMLDRDFANRFLSFYLIGYENYTPDLDTFMSNGMSMLYDLPNDQFENIKQRFIQSMLANYQIFGKHAFRKKTGDNERRKPINKALFDVLSVLFAQLDSQKCKLLIDKKNHLVKGLTRLIVEDEDFFAAITSSTSERKRVYYRFTVVNNLLSNIISHDDSVY